MSFPGKIEDYGSIKELESQHRRRAFDIVRHNLRGDVLHNHVVIVPGPIDSEDYMARKQIQAAADTLENIDGTRRLVWSVDRG